MSKWRLKACPRCKGDVYITKDIDGWFEQCLQCGCRHELRELGDHQKMRVLVPEILHVKENWAKDKDD